MVRWTHLSGDEDRRVNRACVTRAARGFAGRTSWHRWQIIIITTTTKITTNRITARITTGRLVESIRETWIWMVNRRRNGPSPLRVEKKTLRKRNTFCIIIFIRTIHTNCIYRAIEESKREEFFVCITKAYFLYIYLYMR